MYSENIMEVEKSILKTTPALTYQEIKMLQIDFKNYI